MSPPIPNQVLQLRSDRTEQLIESGVPLSSNADEMAQLKQLGHITVTGIFSGTGIGGSLGRVLERYGFDYSMMEYAKAYRKGILQSLAFRWNRQPLNLEQYSDELYEYCRTQRTRILLSTGIVPIAARVAKAIADAGIVFINFLTDDPWNPAFKNRYFLPAMQHFHMVFTPRYSNLQELMDAGAKRVQYLPFGYDDDKFYPDFSIPENDIDMVFVGGCDNDRVKMLTPLIHSNLNVALYGGYWERQPQYRAFVRGVTEPETIRVQTAAAKVSLILVRRANRDGHVMRSFEAAACGGCLLVERTPDHEAVFGPDGVSVRYFSNDRELLPKLRELLSVPDERARLRRAAAERIVGHDYGARLVAMLRAAREEFRSRC